MGSQIREDILKLITERDKIEQEIKELTEILKTNNIGMNEPLVDKEGFPLNSVDVFQVRHARQRINCLQNDHLKIMKQIEQGLHGYYSTTSSNSISVGDVNMERPHISLEVNQTPFAKVGDICEGSPADFAGLLSDDLLIEFGSVNSKNFKNLKDVAFIVEHSQGQQVAVKVKRGDAFVSTTLVPRKWHGKGFLGCNIVVL